MIPANSPHPGATCLPTREMTASAFAPFGQIIPPEADGTLFDANAAALLLDRGTPRLYIMRLHQRAASFDRITRHLQVTQCLSAIGGGAWLLAVAPPDAPDDETALPDPAALVAFRITGPIAIKLHRATWHAGPFFTESAEMDFLNLELADTNQTDHHTRPLGGWYEIGR